MLFLGADASHAFGIGQLQDFITKVNCIFADHVMDIEFHYQNVTHFDPLTIYAIAKMI